MDMEKFLFSLSMLPGLIIGLTFHEAAHAWAAHMLGDDFARSQGRLSLNPLRHLSFIGTLMLFVVGFGWAKPVPVNMYNLRSPKRDFMLVSLAGPASNLTLAIVCALLLRLSAGFDSDIADIIQSQLFYAYLINGMLCVINLLPIPPLDGSRLWGLIIPGRGFFMNKNVQLGGMVLLLALVFSGALDKVISYILIGLSRILF